MKTLKAFLLVSLFLPLLFACSTKFTIPENATIDQNFIGKWEGKHFDEKSGYLKKWIQTRKSDGTYTIQLNYFDKNNKLFRTATDSGHWWIHKGLFHELAPDNMKTPESYLYQFIGKDKIKFISAKENSGYSFVDTRIQK